MSISMVSRWLWPMAALLVSACSEDRLLTKQDYQENQYYFMQGNTKEALLDFPRRAEKGDFITTMEQGYLNLIQGKPDIKPMQREADALENRVRYHISREAKTFFYLLILDSAYGGKAAASSTVAGSKIAATTGLGLAVGLGGTALGAAIINYGTGDALYYGLVVAGASIQKGMNITQQDYEESASKLKQDLDPSISYRFVRYLPEYLWMGWSDQSIAYPVELRTPDTRIKIQHPTITGRTFVTVVQVPDAAQTRTFQ